MDHEDEASVPGDKTEGHLDSDRFAGIVRALEQQDPRFVRRVSTFSPRGLDANNLAAILGTVTTVALGAVPFALGLHLEIAALVVIGAIGLLVLPVSASLILKAVLFRLKPPTQ